MIDWGKYWIRHSLLIDKIFANEELDFHERLSEKTGVIKEFPKYAKWKVWEFEIKSPKWLEITGSLHKYSNNGTNENDFKFYEMFIAIVELCAFLQVSPYDLTVHNLEFGVNIRPAINASEIMLDIVCFKNRTPMKPIDNENGHFIEFAADEYYLKIYNKGLQAQEVWSKPSGNILRFELKATTSGFLKFANIQTMADLLNPHNLILLGRKLDSVFKQVVFDDNSINQNEMSKPDRKVYQELINPRIWAKYRKHKTSTVRAREYRFNEIVERNGNKKHRLTLSKLINRKWQELTVSTIHLRHEIQKYLKNYR